MHQFHTTLSSSETGHLPFKQKTRGQFPAGWPSARVAQQQRHGVESAASVSAAPCRDSGDRTARSANPEQAEPTPAAGTISLLRFWPPAENDLEELHKNSHDRHPDADLSGELAGFICGLRDGKNKMSHIITIIHIPVEVKVNSRTTSIEVMQRPFKPQSREHYPGGPPCFP